MMDIKHLMRIVNKDAIIKQFISHKNGTFQTVGWNPKAKTQQYSMVYMIILASRKAVLCKMSPSRTPHYVCMTSRLLTQSCQLQTPK